ncbi:MAG: hypothetical protein P0Y62_06330 [Candidatus Chryseobacterium colombiense]|nr:hypothetical protein [Chryseobacterium sp.]WEK71170.1 MAG: hypothetical protein P0Y62_06330 [Chryseobacterium sp.]
MDKQIRKLKKIVRLHISQKKEDIRKIWGEPAKGSDEEFWFYSRYCWGIFRDEIAFIFESDKVVDITITECFLWMEYGNIFYYEYGTPEYKVFKFYERE